MNLNWPVHWLDDVDSTNEEAKRRACVAGFQDHWIAARKQTSGRGRLGRVWLSPEGNLYATALFSWRRSLPEMTQIPFVAALAVSDVVAALVPGSSPKLKWPNDVRINGAKVSGILVETGQAQQTRWVATGIGINVGFVPEGVDQAGTSLADLRGDKMVTPQMALEALTDAFAARLTKAADGFEHIRKAWLERAEALGQRVRVTANGAPIEGIFKEMAEDGALLLHLPSGEVRPIRAGDVELIKEVMPK